MLVGQSKLGDHMAGKEPGVIERVRRLPRDSLAGHVARAVIR